MTLEVVVYWIVVIFFALPIALGALLYLWRTINGMFRAPDAEDSEEAADQYWKDPD